MEMLFRYVSLAMGLASLPAGYWLACHCTKSGGGRVALTLFFGAILLLVALQIGVTSGCSTNGLN